MDKYLANVIWVTFIFDIFIKHRIRSLVDKLHSAVSKLSV